MQIVFGYRSIGRAYAMRIFRYGVPVSDPLRAPALLTRADAQSGICLSEANYAVQRPNALAGKAGIISKETRTGGGRGTNLLRDCGRVAGAVVAVVNGQGRKAGCSASCPENRLWGA